MLVQPTGTSAGSDPQLNPGTCTSPTTPAQLRPNSADRSFQAQRMRTSVQSIPGNGWEQLSLLQQTPIGKATLRGAAAPGQHSWPQPQPLPRVNTWQQHEGLSPLLRWQHGALGGARAAGCIPIEEAEAGSALWEQLVAHAGGQPCQAVCPHNARLPARHQPPLRVQVGAEAHLWEKSGS